MKRNIDREIEVFNQAMTKLIKENKDVVVQGALPDRNRVKFTVVKDAGEKSFYSKRCNDEAIKELIAKTPIDIIRAVAPEYEQLQKDARERFDKLNERSLKERTKLKISDYLESHTAVMVHELILDKIDKAEVQTHGSGHKK